MTTSLVRTRHAEGRDVGGVVDLHRRCSTETLSRRFHAPVIDVSPQLATLLIAPTGGWSVVAEQCEEIVGMGCAGALSSTVLEIGLLVEDAHQGTGVGSRMLRDLAAEAPTRGFHTLVCLTRPDDESVLRTVRRVGLDGETWHGDGVLEIRIDVSGQRDRLRPPA